MAYLKFLDSNDLLTCTVVPQGKNLVSLKFKDSVVVNTSGFKLYLDEKKEYEIGDYSAFTTLYRNDDTTAEYNGYLLSNDGSIYVEPEVPEPEIITPIEPTLEEVIEQKVVEMNNAQQNAISAGVNVTLSDGTVEHFTLTDHDQTSLIGLQTQVDAGVESIPWHTSDQTEHCKYYSNTDMALITQAALQYTTYHVTYFRDLRIYIRSLTEKEEVEAIYYGVAIPEEYQSEPLKNMLALMA